MAGPGNPEPPLPPPPQTPPPPPAPNDLAAMLRFVQDQQQLVLNAVQDQQQKDRTHIRYLIGGLIITLTVLGAFFGWIGWNNYKAALESLVTEKFRDRNIQEEIETALANERDRIVPRLQAELLKLMEEQVRGEEFAARVRKAVELEFQKKVPEIRRVVDDRTMNVVSERLKPRELSDTQLDQLYTWLNGRNENFIVQWARGDTDSEGVRYRILRYWQQKGRPYGGGGEMFCREQRGILASGPTDEATKEFIAFLGKIGFPDVRTNKTLLASPGSFCLTICPKP